jgi:multidrug resistance efflux pump
VQAWRALRRVGARLGGPGHWAWKAGAAAAVLVLAVLLLVPVDDRVTAHTVIEGRTRQLVTAPFEGFIAEALVRPGDRVRQGQVLLRLDDRDLKLEQAKLRGERDQAASRLRQAMADREAAGVALASAELQGAEGQLALVEAKLARARLVAPIDGLVVTGDWVQQVGAPAESGKELFEIASEGYRVVLHVPERDIARVRTGQRGVVGGAGRPQDGGEIARSRIRAEPSDGHGQRARRHQRFPRRSRLGGRRAGAEPRHAGCGQGRGRHVQPADDLDARVHRLAAPQALAVLDLDDMAPPRDLRPLPPSGASVPFGRPGGH